MSSKRNYLSGFQKRKKKKDFEDSMKKHKKIDMFVKTPSPSTTKLDQPTKVLNSNENDVDNSTLLKDISTDTASTSRSNVNNRDYEQIDVRSNTSEKKIIIDGSSSSSSLTYGSALNSQADSTDFEEKCVSDSISGKEVDFSQEREYRMVNSEEHQNEIISTDMGDFINKPLTDDIRRYIVTSIPCQPEGPFIRDQTQGNRHFSEKYYYCPSKYGQVKRNWLCYSKKLDVAYCAPCWLFGSGNACSNPWRHGVRDWQGLSKKIKKHSSGQNHTESCRVYDVWKKNNVIDHEINSLLDQEQSFWSKVLERLFDITLTLAKNSLSFRGHKEYIKEGGENNYSGNFLSLVKLLSKYDDTLKQIIDKPEKTIKYLSPTIQNELIDCLGSSLEKILITDIQNSPFFSIILDSTQDISKKDQMSITIRYVRINRDLNQEVNDLEIKESFLGFFNSSDHSASGITDLIINFLAVKNIDISKCRGQGYDGASVMRGAYNGVQTKVKQIQPLAEYVHCAAHNLNLVINDAVNGVLDVSNFFATLQEIYIFFGSSIVRWDLLSTFTGESEMTLKKLNPTRWSSRITTLRGIKCRFMDVEKALTEISLKSSKQSERNEACQLIKKISNFEFVFLLVILSDIFNEINVASQVLQKRNIEFNEAGKILNSVKENLKESRNKYNVYKQEAIDICSLWKIQPLFKAKRNVKVKRHFDEMSDSYIFESNEKKFKVNVFYKTIDIINTQINERFDGMLKTLDLFQCLMPKNLMKLTDKELIVQADKLREHYSEDLSPGFSLQLINAASIFKNHIQEQTTVRDLIELLLIKYSFLESDFSEVITAGLLYLTLPVTVASAERSFSKLKLIKNYTRSTMAQKRLKHLALLAIESDTTKRLKMKELIHDFANSKARRVKI